MVAGEDGGILLQRHINLLPEDPVLPHSVFKTCQGDLTQSDFVLAFSGKWRVVPGVETRFEGASKVPKTTPTGEVQAKPTPAKDVPPKSAPAPAPPISRPPNPSGTLPTGVSTPLGTSSVASVTVSFGVRLGLESRAKALGLVLPAFTLACNYYL